MSPRYGMVVDLQIPTVRLHADAPNPQVHGFADTHFRVFRAHGNQTSIDLRLGRRRSLLRRYGRFQAPQDTHCRND